MRQAIKSDGSDGTTALKAWLATHDEFLTQELYEFQPPAVGGGLVVMPAPEFEVEDSTHALMRTTHGTFVPYEPDWADFGSFEVGGASGKLKRWYSVTLGGFNLPGTLFWDFAPAGPYGAPGSDSGSVPPRARISHVMASMTVYTVPDPSHPGFDPPITIEVSIDGGSSWHLVGFPLFVHTPTEFDVDITGLINALPGGIANFDFTQVKFQAFNSSTAFVPVFGPPAGWQFFISDVGLRFVYSSGGGGGSSLFGVSGLPANITDASSPLTYAARVYASANVKNNGFKSKIGLDVDSLQISWTFRGDEPMVTDPGTGATILTMLQAFKYGLWAGVWVKWRRIYMPTFGDCETLAAVSMFRGKIADVEVDRLTAKITVNSITEMFNRQVPQQLIEANNRSGQVGPGLPPDLNPDPAHWTYFKCAAGAGGTTQKIVADETAPTADEVYAPGTFDLGYLLFQSSPLKFFVAQVQRYAVEAGHSVFYLFKPLYVDPHAYGLTFVAFVPIPKDQTISGAAGLELPPFPFVPLPEQAV